MGTENPSGNRDIAYWMANRAAVLEHLVGPGDLFVVDIERVAQVEPHSTVLLRPDFGPDNVFEFVSEKRTHSRSLTMSVEVRRHPMMLVGWDKEAIKRVLCEQVDHLFNFPPLEQRIREGESHGHVDITGQYLPDEEKPDEGKA